MPTHLEINHSDVPVRLFKSDFLEFFTHIHPAIVLLIWVPIAIFFLIRGILARPAGASLWYVPICLVVGVFVWTFAEYMGHRFVFHFNPRTPRQEKIIFYFHGIHHYQPQCKTRLVMPPAVSVPVAFIFYGLYYVIVDVILGMPHWFGPLFAGFLAGYVAYDMIHYATHHFPMRAGVLKFLKRYHMQHHYKTPDRRFGVSSPLWDIVFSTRPPESPSAGRVRAGEA